ncbi:hypothetical protein P8452_20201 [Trifolium repens]|nr:hypothetical protein P8452_20201 [Trifolium repens]
MLQYKYDEVGFVFNEHPRHDKEEARRSVLVAAKLLLHGILVIMSFALLFHEQNIMVDTSIILWFLLELLPSSAPDAGESLSLSLSLSSIEACLDLLLYTLLVYYSEEKIESVMF